MRIAGVSVAQDSAAQRGPVSAGASGAEAGSWLGALERTLVSPASPGQLHGRMTTPPDSRISQLSDLIKIQMEVCRHQVQVELVSKVAESGVASVRKLQQPQ